MKRTLIPSFLCFILTNDLLRVVTSQRLNCVCVCDLVFATDDTLPVGCVFFILGGGCTQGRLQDGQRAEKRGQQEVRLQRRPAAQLPQTVPPSGRQLRVDTPLPCIQTLKCKNDNFYHVKCMLCNFISHVGNDPLCCADV